MKINAIGHLVKTNPIQSQSPALGRKSEALSPKFETILQNKANFQKDRMSANIYLTRDYEEKPRFWLEKNKAKQTQFRGNSSTTHARIIRARAQQTACDTDASAAYSPVGYL